MTLKKNVEIYADSFLKKSFTERRNYRYIFTTKKNEEVKKI